MSSPSPSPAGLLDSVEWCRLERYLDVLTLPKVEDLQYFEGNMMESTGLGMVWIIVGLACVLFGSAFTDVLWLLGVWAGAVIGHVAFTEQTFDEAGVADVAAGFKPILAYVASLASNQCVAETFHMFEWEKTCKAYLTPILADEEKCAAVTKKFMDESEKRVPKREVELDIPEGEGEILCNVEFKLAYGGKILLNTTHFHVRRGRIYGLLGHNGCGKSTLAQAVGLTMFGTRPEAFKGKGTSINGFISTISYNIIFNPCCVSHSNSVF